MLKYLLPWQTDSYKLTHWKQYPKGTEHVYSYLESRGGQFDEVVANPMLQYILGTYLAGRVVTLDDVHEAKILTDAHIGKGHFNEAGWAHIANRHGGLLPLVIKAVPEGTVVPGHNVLLTIENTCPECYWLPNYMETVLLQVWYPTTVATVSREIKKVILRFLAETGDPALVGFKLHDFGYRGVSSQESAAIGGAAHLINFMGSDTLAGIMLLRQYYGADMPGFSIPAAEHSTITSWGRDHEADAYENMLTQYPEGLVAVVSDSYNIFEACEKIWGGILRDKVRARQGTVVIRPDSGDPATTVLKCLEILGDKFGYDVNSKGFKVLNPKVRVIQGDGVEYQSIIDILSTIKGKGWSADNLAFGMGGALLQKLNRDTLKFAIKCSNVTVKGQDIEVWKDPVTDSGKASKRGRLALVNMYGRYATVQKVKGITIPEDELVTVFKDGEVTQTWTLDDLRTRADVTVEDVQQAVA